MMFGKYGKIGIGVGITIVSLILLVLSNVIPIEISNLEHQFSPSILKYEIQEEMMKLPSYVAFMERFPDSPTIDHDGSDEIHLSVEEVNEKTLNSLRLNLRYDAYEKRIIEEVLCLSLTNADLTHDSSMDSIVAFIKNTSCLEDDFEFP